MNSQKLIDWFKLSGRQLAWRKISDPYAIWLAEIILQQTRVAQGMPYFERFLLAFPTVRALAEAPEDQVMKAWEGLGYYSRARNLHKAARIIATQHNGKMPDTLDALLALPGVGPYTARAVAAFAFHLPHAVVDGNVCRVISRVEGDPTPIDTPTGKKHFQQRADAWLSAFEKPNLVCADYNNAIMDLGATVCTPRKPRCPQCPLNDACVAYRTDNVYGFPVKQKKNVRQDRYFIFWALQNDNGELLFYKRDAAAYWKNLWCLPCSEVASPFSGVADFFSKKDKKELENPVSVGSLVHEFTHFRMHCHLLHLPAANANREKKLTQIAGLKDTNNDFVGKPITWADEKTQAQLALPRAIHKMLALMTQPRQNKLFD